MGACSRGVREEETGPARWGRGSSNKRESKSFATAQTGLSVSSASKAAAEDLNRMWVRNMLDLFFYARALGSEYAIRVRRRGKVLENTKTGETQQ